MPARRGAGAVILPGSRYASLDTYTTADLRRSTEPLAGSATRPIPAPAALRLHRVRAGERLDQIAHRYYGDPLKYWLICDANDAIFPSDLLVPGGCCASPSTGGAEMATAARVLRILLDGKEDSRIYSDLMAVEVQQDTTQRSMFAIQIHITILEDGSWTYLDQEDSTHPTFSLWQRVTIEAGFSDSADVVIDGYVAGIDTDITPETDDASVTVWGYDPSFAMDQEAKFKSWPDKTFSDIATEIFQSYQLTAEVTDSLILHAQDEDLLVQRSSDWQYLKELAARLGYELFIEGAKGHFRLPDVEGTIQKDIAAHFGPSSTNLIWFRGRVAAGAPQTYRRSRLNLREKTMEPVEVTASPLAALSARGAAAQIAGRSVAGMPTAQPARPPVGSAAELTAQLTGRRQEASWIGTGEGELDGVLYGRALRAGRLVLIKGVGRDFSGRHYVERVVHRLTAESYTQRFWVRRDGIGELGDEPYQGVDGDPSGLDIRDTEKVTTAAGGRQVLP